MGLATTLTWIFHEQVAVPAFMADMMIAGEEAIVAFKTVRDVAVFTTKRLVVIDSQGITGRKKEIYSLPYKSILMWSTENAGTMDFTSEVELWTKLGTIKISLAKNVDVRQFDQLLAQVCL